MPTQNYIVKTAKQAIKLGDDAFKEASKSDASFQRALVNGAYFVAKDGNLEVLSKIIAKNDGNTRQKDLKSWVTRTIGVEWSEEGYKGNAKMKAFREEYNTDKVDWFNDDDPALKALIEDMWSKTRKETRKANIDFVADLTRLAKKVEKNPDIAQKQSVQAQLACQALFEAFKAKQLTVAKAKKAA
tara:strand:+ start:579 stop:1136 length:558 start_codon:yes stop_codon:yes gene_type:complete